MESAFQLIATAIAAYVGFVIVVGSISLIVALIIFYKMRNL